MSDQPLKILVLAGGDSNERAVSLRSGKAVASSLEAKGHTVTLHDPIKKLTREQAKAVDVVFPVLHGAGGEDGVIQELLEDFGIPYVGSAVVASQLCFDKSMHRTKVQRAGIRMPNGNYAWTWSLDDDPLFEQPFVLKPYAGGSSLDTFVVRDVAAADWEAITGALEKYGEMLLEELIVGTEITIGVLGDTPLPVIEIIPPQSGEFDYENKYNGATQELCPPKNVSAEVQLAAQGLALTIHQLCDCRDFSRTDMIVDAEDKLWVLETNTIPGMTDQSLFPKSAAVAGVIMPELVDQLVRRAVARHTQEP
jgi:D-alanine-D-alanine ligase